MKKIILILVFISQQFYANCISDDEKEFLEDLVSENKKLLEIGWSFENDFNEWKGLTITDCAITGIDLSSFNLKKIPNSIFYLKKIEVLKFNKAGLSRNLFSLQNLKVLHINNRSIGKNIVLLKRLKNLRELRITNSYLKKIPEEILELVNLEYVDFSHNSIEEFSEDILSLKKLKHLSLGNNKYLKGDIGLLNSFSQLEYLDVSNTRFSGSFVTLSPNLKYLNFNNINVYNLNIENTNKLEVLKIENCGLKEVIGFKNQHKLKGLNIKDNYINYLIVENMVELDSINISKNEFTSIPLLPKNTIAYLNISSNPIFDFSNDDFDILTKVKSIDLSYMGFEKLPSRINKLENCEVLNLSNNKLEKIKLDGLKNLKSLNLRKNKLSSFNLNNKKLQSLNLLRNDFVEMPKSIYEFENLEVFLIDNFTLKKVPKKFLSLKKLKEIYLHFQGEYDEVLCELRKRGVSLENNYYMKCDK